MNDTNFIQSFIESIPLNILAILGLSILLIILISIFAYIFLFLCDKNTAYVYQRFGKFLKVSREGINYRIPFLDKRIEEINLQPTGIPLTVVAKTKDNITLIIELSLQYRIPRDLAHRFCYGFKKPDEQIPEYISNTMISYTASKIYDEIKTLKNISWYFIKVLGKIFNDNGYKIDTVLIKKMEMQDEDIINSFNKVVVEEKNSKAARIRAVAKANEIITESKAHDNASNSLFNTATKHGALKGSQMINYRRESERNQTMREIGSKSNSNLIVLPTTTSSSESSDRDIIRTQIEQERANNKTGRKINRRKYKNTGYKGKERRKGRQSTKP